MKPKDLLHLSLMDDYREVGPYFGFSCGFFNTLPSSYIMENFEKYIQLLVYLNQSMYFLKTQQH